ncbi:MAG: hypothetical protein R3290_00250 [Acidimicrobiia bacterium]|nr:hypothetical protein [Acidimicrobiia bacterium]
MESVARAKETASAIAVELTTYWEDDDHAQRLAPLVPPGEGDALVGAAAPLLHPGRWSYGEVTYPQMGGFDGERASVMVVTRQTVGSDDGAEFSVVRTLDIRLALGAADWEFEALASAGGAFEDLDDLRLAHRVADDPRIEMPDSARLDIREGQVSPVLLELMAELADQTPYGVVTLATGHPYHVFETDRVSHHSVGRAVDIYRIGDRRVFDDRDPGSTTQRITEWLLERDEVVQVGSPWDLDGEASRRSFADLVHQDHLHVAVRTEAELAERLDPAGEGGQEGSGG